MQCNTISFLCMLLLWSLTSRSHAWVSDAGLSIMVSSHSWLCIWQVWSWQLMYWCTCWWFSVHLSQLMMHLTDVMFKGQSMVITMCPKCFSETHTCLPSLIKATSGFCVIWYPLIKLLVFMVETWYWYLWVANDFHFHFKVTSGFV